MPTLEMSLSVIVWILVALVAVATSPDATAQTSESPKTLAEELPRIAPVEPDKAIGTFELQQGFQLELVAAEPLVADPVDACFDANGRMYVAEMHGYPFSFEPTQKNPAGGGKKDGGIIRLLEDTDNDGVFDRSVVFADKITWPTSVCCYDGGVFVLASPHLHYLKDTNGDDIADIRRIVFTGFSRDNVQGLANNMKWTLDNRIAVAGGRLRAELKHADRTVVPLGGQDFAFDPRTESVEPLTGGGQFGHSMNDWGERFLCSNSNHIQHVVYPHRYLKRNADFAVSAGIRSIAKEGPAAPVFRRSSAEPWRVVRTRRRVSDPEYRKRLSQTERFAVGFFTSATGVTVYRGSAYPQQFRGNVFIGDVGGNLIHRKTLRPNGVTFLAERADQQSEFIASTDNWFRPVNFVNAPDGTLFILDMYRETIEHPASIPEDIKQHLYLESGDERGRIYRLTSPGMERIVPPNLQSATTAELVANLNSGHSWNRETAQRLLWEGSDLSAIPALRELIHSSASSLGRLHALHTLQGLDQLDEETLLTALADEDPRIREHAIRLSESHNNSPRIVNALNMLAKDSDARIRFQLAFSAGQLDDRNAVKLLSRLIRNSTFNSDIENAILTSLSGRVDALVFGLLEDEEFLGQQHASHWIGDLSQIIARSSQPQVTVKLLGLATELSDHSQIREQIFRSVGGGLLQHGSSISQLLSHSRDESRTKQLVNQYFRATAELALNPDVAPAKRKAAIELLGFSDDATALRSLSTFLSPKEPQEYQLAAVRAISNQPDESITQSLLANWSSYSPSVRNEIIDALLRTRRRMLSLLDSIESQAIQPTDIAPDKRELLANHPRSDIRDRAREVFDRLIDSDRANVVDQYRGVLRLEGNPARGEPLFVKHCSICHRVADKGHQVGPDLASIQNKSDADLLIAILDPNREAQPNYTNYAVATLDGRLLNGMIAAETATSLTLRRAEGKQDVVMRSQIDVLSSTGKSLMPEGLEKELNPQDICDLMAFVRTIKPAVLQ